LAACSVCCSLRFSYSQIIAQTAAMPVANGPADTVEQLALKTLHYGGRSDDKTPSPIPAWSAPRDPGWHCAALLIERATTAREQ
jgi:hypothetical protein